MVRYEKFVTINVYIIIDVYKCNIGSYLACHDDSSVFNIFRLNVKEYEWKKQLESVKRTEYHG